MSELNDLRPWAQRLARHPLGRHIMIGVVRAALPLAILWGISEGVKIGLDSWRREFREMRYILRKEKPR